MNIVRSEILEVYTKKGLPMHMYCADTTETVELCVNKGAALITANDPLPLINYLRNNLF